MSVVVWDSAPGCAVAEARPSPGTASGSPHTDTATRTQREWGKGQGGRVGGRREICGKVLLCLCQDLLAIVCLRVTPLNGPPGIGPSGSELGSKPGFSSQLRPERLSLHRPGQRAGSVKPSGPSNL